MPRGPAPPFRLSARVVASRSRPRIRAWRARLVSTSGPVTLRAIWTAAAAHQVSRCSLANTADGRRSMRTLTGLRTGRAAGAADGDGLGSTAGDGLEVSGEPDGSGAESVPAGDAPGEEDGTIAMPPGVAGLGWRTPPAMSPATFQAMSPTTAARTRNPISPRSLRIPRSMRARRTGGGSYTGPVSGASGGARWAGPR